MSSNVIIKMASTSLESFQSMLSSIPRRSMYAVLPLTAGTVIIILQWRQRKASKSKPKPKDPSAPKEAEPKALKSPQKSSKKTLPTPPIIYEDSTATAAPAATPAPPSYREHIANKFGRSSSSKDSSRQPLKESQPKSPTKPATEPKSSAATVMDRPYPKRNRFSEEMMTSSSLSHAPAPTIIEPTVSHLPGMGRPNSVYELQSTSKSSSDLLLHSDVENDPVLEADDEGTPGSPSWLAKVQSWERKHGRRGLKSGSQEKLGVEGVGHEQQSPLAEKGKTFLRKLKGGKAKMEVVMSP
ncbi:hypothetical protein K490DRAFT_66237 [Saccharata proteae CBS 121410]|uniref:Uncharacterized protein n=1 Tax=Saccharata proteae CBS 121410 TaxID=1314787 RepID=A0A9P4HUV7_9PEZI|nr:hypothetical protein K490DRAFT_66237 [Saccharata proteae CBS 121410]